MSKVVRIERIDPPEGGPEVPLLTPKGYQLADPAHGKERHHAKHAVYAPTLERAAELIKQGFSIWMKQEGKRQTLISPKSLRIVR
ncbi:hypothetical protein [Chthonobacter rhizosphaerae]|uniref:hypothetical protein n=1 Tax=Chthonobacter rhizosphaerae TaxID=2735553 RepID=UPI0015EEE5F4|nr:hypothetical protein [Chthonobacter rhizosphaerae]